LNIINYIKTITRSKYFKAGLLFVICIVVGIQSIGLDEIANFIIFKTTSQRFLAHENLYDYIQYGIIYDKFFYSPQFAIFFLPFSVLPLKISVFLWLLLGAGLFYWAIQKLPLTNLQKTGLFFIALIDVVNSLQNLQTNALNTALMLFIFICLYGNKPVLAALCVAVCLSIKIYPAAAGLLFLFYPGKIKFLIWSFLFTGILFFLPFLLIPKEYYFSSLENWLKAVSEDAQDKFIYSSPSLVGINYTWFSKPINHFYIQLSGLFVVFIPLIKVEKKQVDTNFVLLYLSFIMLFVVIFNHAAESPTYVIAITGAAIWYVTSPKSRSNHILLIFLFVGCILLPTDIYPSWLRKEYFMPLKIRVVPCLLIWIKIFYELLTYRKVMPMAQSKNSFRRNII
jgi:hypothetical protein